MVDIGDAKVNKQMAYSGIGKIFIIRWLECLNAAPGTSSGEKALDRDFRETGKRRREGEREGFPRWR
jgi:hypothetical protein